MESGQCHSGIENQIRKLLPCREEQVAKALMKVTKKMYHQTIQNFDFVQVAWFFGDGLQK